MRKPCFHQPVLVVDRRTLEVAQAVGVDHRPRPWHELDLIARLGLGVEPQRILESGAAPPSTATRRPVRDGSFSASSSSSASGSRGLSDRHHCSFYRTERAGFLNSGRTAFYRGDFVTPDTALKTRGESGLRTESRQLVCAGAIVASRARELGSRARVRVIAMRSRSRSSLGRSRSRPGAAPRGRQVDPVRVGRVGARRSTPTGSRSPTT